MLYIFAIFNVTRYISPYYPMELQKIIKTNQKEKSISTYGVNLMYRPIETKSAVLTFCVLTTTESRAKI